MLDFALIKRVLQQSMLFRVDDDTREVDMKLVAEEKEERRGGRGRMHSPTPQAVGKRPVIESSSRRDGGGSLCSPIALVVMAALLITLLQDSLGTSNGEHCGASVRPTPRGSIQSSTTPAPPPSSLPTFLRVFELCAADYDVGVTISDILRFIVPVFPSHVNVCPAAPRLRGPSGATPAPQHAAPHPHPMVLFTEELQHILNTNPHSNEMMKYVFAGLVAPTIHLFYMTMPFFISHFLYRSAFPLLEPTVLAGVLALFVAREVCRRTHSRRAGKSIPVAAVDFISTFGWAWIVSVALLVLVAVVTTATGAAFYNSVSPYLVARMAGVDAPTVRYETGLFKRQLLMC